MLLRSSRAVRNLLRRTLPPGRQRSTNVVGRADLAQAALKQDETFLPPAAPVASASVSAYHADLRAAFDRPVASRRPSTSTDSPASSLFLLPPLIHPSVMPRLTDRTLHHGKAIVQRIRDAPFDPTGRELRLVVKNLDRLSDLLCGVIDMCELVRNVHPDDQWVEVCDAAYERLCSFMNELNTDQGLYRVSRSSCD